MVLHSCLTDGRRLGHPKLADFTVNAGIATLVISRLIEQDNLTGQAVACLAGVPEVYDVASRVRRYPVSV